MSDSSFFTIMFLCGSRSFVTPRTVVCQAPVFMGFSREEYWSGLPFSPPEDLPNPGMEPSAFVSPALADKFITTAPLTFHKLV